MSDPITRNFNATLQKTYEWLKDVEDSLFCDDRPTAYHALRAVLHALRDRLPPVEACELAAGLPTLLRGIYFEGWSPAGKPEKMDKEEFFERVRELAGPTSGDLNPARCVPAVFGVLGQRIAAGEIEDIRDVLPASFAELWPAA
jgi:uncharacterized protein (DUF2267 family)